MHSLFRKALVALVGAALLIGCARPKTFDQAIVVRATVATPAAATHSALAPQRSSKVAAAARARRRRDRQKWIDAYFTIKYEEWLHSLFLEAHPPPAPVSAMRCPAGPIKYEIESVFGEADPWAESIAWRESNCTEGAFNPSGSSGLFQLLGHQDLLRLVCPTTDPALSVFDYGCNTLAAWNLYLEEGVAPWRE